MLNDSTKSFRPRNQLGKWLDCWKKIRQGLDHAILVLNLCCNLPKLCCNLLLDNTEAVFDDRHCSLQQQIGRLLMVAEGIIQVAVE